MRLTMSWPVVTTDQVSEPSTLWSNRAVYRVLGVPDLHMLMMIKVDYWMQLMHLSKALATGVWTPAVQVASTTTLLVKGTSSREG